MFEKQNLQPQFSVNALSKLIKEAGSWIKAPHTLQHFSFSYLVYRCQILLLWYFFLLVLSLSGSNSWEGWNLQLFHGQARLWYLISIRKDNNTVWLVFLQTILMLVNCMALVKCKCFQNRKILAARTLSPWPWYLNRAVKVIVYPSVFPKCSL